MKRSKHFHFVVLTLYCIILSYEDLVNLQYYFFLVGPNTLDDTPGIENLWILQTIPLCIVHENLKNVKCNQCLIKNNENAFMKND